MLLCAILSQHENIRSFWRLFDDFNLQILSQKSPIAVRLQTRIVRGAILHRTKSSVTKVRVCFRMWTSLVVIVKKNTENYIVNYATLSLYLRYANNVQRNWFTRAHITRRQYFCERLMNRLIDFNSNYEIVITIFRLFRPI